MSFTQLLRYLLHNLCDSVVGRNARASRGPRRPHIKLSSVTSWKVTGLFPEHLRRQFGQSLITRKSALLPKPDCGICLLQSRTWRFSVVSRSLPERKCRLCSTSQILPLNRPVVWKRFPWKPRDRTIRLVWGRCGRAPWQRGPNKNTSRLSRQAFPKPATEATSVKPDVTTSLARGRSAPASAGVEHADRSHGGRTRGHQINRRTSNLTPRLSIGTLRILDRSCHDIA